MVNLLSTKAVQYTHGALVLVCRSGSSGFKGRDVYAFAASQLLEPHRLPVLAPKRVRVPQVRILRVDASKGHIEEDARLAYGGGVAPTRVQQPSIVDDGLAAPQQSSATRARRITSAVEM